MEGNKVEEAGTEEGEVEESELEGSEKTTPYFHLFNL